MISGVTVTVKRRVLVGYDRLNDPIYGSSSEEVGNVLVVPGATSDMEASRPEGVTVAYTLHFPKGFADSLEGCVVALPAPWAGDYKVIGDPKPYIDADTPTPWHTTVEVEAARG